MQGGTRIREPLWFELSYLQLFSIRSEMLVYSCSLRNLLAGEETPPPASAHWPEEIQGVLLRSTPLAERLPPIHAVGDTIRYVANQYERYYIDLRGTFHDYFQKHFSSKSRSTLRRRVRKFAKAGSDDLDWRIYRTPGELREFHRLARRISEQTYQEKLLDLGLPDSRQFKEQMDAAAARDQIRAYLLFLEGESVAYLYCLLIDGILIYQYLGYLPAHASLSPGTVLQMKVLEAAFDEPACEFFDFTEGEGAQKRLFSSAGIPCGNVYYFRKNARNTALVRAHYAATRISAGLGSALERLGLKTKVRALLRRFGGS